MQLAASTLFCLHKPLEDTLADLVLLSTKHVELVDAGPHTLNKTRIDRLLELEASYDLNYSLHAPFTDMNLAADDNYVRESVLRRLERSIRWTSALGAEVMIFHPGNSTAVERFFPGSAWRLNIESVRRLFRYADNYGVKALIENVPEPFPYVMKSVDDFTRFFDEVGFDVKFVLDVAHAHLRGEIVEFIKRHGSLIGHVHVSDNHGEVDTHLQVGRGAIDWEGTMTSLKASSFDGWITVESYRGVEESLQLLRSFM